MTTARACLLAALVWAAIYLPGLGSLEIKGEEGRRILPAVAMLDTGNWIVPQVGGVPYLSKPPLINWLVAAAFRVSGTRNEWAARAPSVLAVLALALTMVGTLGGLLTPAGGLLGTVFVLTNIGLMEKGRLAEIEALYVSLYGMALCLWLGAWRRETTAGTRPSWRTWTLPWLALGLGLLTKGPLHLLFFYAVVVGVLACARRLRDLWNPAHLAGIVLMLGIFGVWAVPYLRQTAASGAEGVWLAQFQGRMEVNESFHLGSWLLNIPRGLVNYLPWVVLLPLAWRGRPRREASAPEPTNLDAAILGGLRWGAAGCFLVVSLAPGGQPRYTLPLLVPASLWLALVLVRPSAGGLGALLPPLPGQLPLVWNRVIVACVAVAMAGAVAVGLRGGPAFLLRWGTVLGLLVAGYTLLERLPRWRAAEHLSALGLASAAGMALLTADFVFGATRTLRLGESVRPVGRQISRLVGPGEAVAVLRPGFLPFLFYVRHPHYVQRIENLPVAIPYLLLRENELDAVAEALRHRRVITRIAMRARDKRIKDDRLNTWLLLRLDSTVEPGL